jgi:hypothetical protein
MKETQRTNYVLRNGIMNLLSDEEVARIGTTETVERLLEGDEYVDLNQLDRGVLSRESDR